MTGHADEKSLDEIVLSTWETINNHYTDVNCASGKKSGDASRCAFALISAHHLRLLSYLKRLLNIHETAVELCRSVEGLAMEMQTVKAPCFAKSGMRIDVGKADRVNRACTKLSELFSDWNQVRPGDSEDEIRKRNGISKEIVEAQSALNEFVKESFVNCATSNPQSVDNLIFLNFLHAMNNFARRSFEHISYVILQFEHFKSNTLHASPGSGSLKRRGKSNIREIFASNAKEYIKSTAKFLYRCN